VSDSSQTPGPEPAPTQSADAQTVPDAAPRESSGSETAASERPELIVGAALAGGFVLAMILRRLAR
jgi:hypothetical protein